MVSDFLEGPHNFFTPRSRLAQWSSGVQHTRIGEVQFTGPALQGPMPSNSFSIRALGIRYKGFGEQREQRYEGIRERRQPHAI